MIISALHLFAFRLKDYFESSVLNSNILILLLYLLKVPYQPGNTRGISVTETFVVTACVRRTTDSIEKRWCFDVTAQEKSQHPLTFQAMGKKDRDEWLSALEGKEPDYAALGYLGGGE